MAALPEPRPGLVVGYSYLWQAEFAAGLEEGRKDRPCAVVIASRTEEGDLVVTVAAITHAAPANPEDAVELPLAAKQALGLDEQRSWIVCAELNRFVWPGPDLRPVSRNEPGRFVHGKLPGPFMLRVFNRLAALRDGRRLRVVRRS